MEKIFRITNRLYGKNQKPATDGEVLQLSTDITIPAPFTAKEIKQKYESNSNTNSFTDAYKHKLEIIEPGAERNKKVSLREVMKNSNTTDYALQITDQRNLNRNVNSLGICYDPWLKNAEIQLYKDQQIISSIEMNDGYMKFVTGMTSISLNPETADTSGIETDSRISCERAKNNNEVTTLEQVKELITDTKRYRALASQTETNAPVVTVLENTLDTTLTYTRIANFDYRITSERPIFLLGKTFLSSISGYMGNGKLIRVSDTELKIMGAEDGTLVDASLEINIYK
ncbi:hypothetical protein IUY40_18565 [Flavobacterium sp. ALJ2]|uniref:hypothetical protein n=1 Tax=Flavobacterium sp. ALJ2 TaxID=2786960 RepID=UPI00189E2F94|nr:hypothetical protein [Flavobacterium sp. ALJ2]MBF7093540.1 hypothetical protein [Flavobacterium sp. ALJ2]